MKTFPKNDLLGPFTASLSPPELVGRVRRKEVVTTDAGGVVASTQVALQTDNVEYHIEKYLKR